MAKLLLATAALGVFLLFGFSEASPDREAACALLDDPGVRSRISAGLELKLTLLCEGSLPRRSSASSTTLEDGGPSGSSTPAGGVDALVNDPSLDVGGSTQSETTIVVAGDVVCVAWNDTGESLGFTGFGFSHDGGATFTDGGGFPVLDTFTDPSLAYSVRDDTFYFAALYFAGIGLWASEDDCSTFQFVRPIHGSFGDDKELMAIDNEPSSPFFGRIHVGWTNFAISGDRSQVAYSDDAGVTWSAPATLPGSGPEGIGVWPAVAPNGDVYFALSEFLDPIGSTQDVRIMKSTDGGSSWTRMPDIASDLPRAENVAASMRCNRQALNGDIRNSLLPQIAIHPDASASAGYVIHAVYHYDADGPGPDESDAFYKRSTDGAVTWSAGFRLNDDPTTTDQWYPTLGVNSDGVVAVSWYDRRLDPANLLFDRFATLSQDGGLTFEENLLVSDVSSPVSQNLPHFDGLADCYHGDYDQLVVDDARVHLVWSDDRRVTATGPNPDIYYDQILLPEPPAAWGAVASLAAIALCHRLRRGARRPGGAGGPS